MAVLRLLFGDALPVSIILGALLFLGNYFQESIDAAFLLNKWSVLILHWLFPMVLFIVYGFILFLVDTNMSQAYRAQVKIQPSFVPNATDYFRAVKVAAFNWLVLGLPFGVLMCLVVVPLREQWPCWRGDSSTLLPSAFEYFSHIVVFAIVEEFLFFYSHRWLHSKEMYASVHKVR